MPEPVNENALQTEQPTISLRDYLAALARRKWLMAAIVVVAVAIAAAVTYTRTPLYTATATLAFDRASSATTQVVGATYYGTTDVQRELATAADLIPGDMIGARAEAVMAENGVDEAPAPVTVAVPEETNILSISATSASPEVAAATANAYAQAFTSWRREQAVTQIQAAAAFVRAKLSKYQTQTDIDADPGTYYSLSSRLQDLEVSEKLATGNYLIVAPASVPTQPSSPNHTRDILVGLGAGVLLAVIAAFLAEQLDVRVRDQDAIVQALRLPVLGRIPAVAKSVVRSGELAVVSDPDGVSAEAFRMLRGNLDFVNVDGNLTTILVTSLTAGEGKTSTVCNLGVTLARGGKRVILVEADLRRPRVHGYFGIKGAPGLTDVLTGRVSLQDAVIKVPIDSAQTPVSAKGGLAILTAGTPPPNPGELILSERLRQLLSSLRERSDIVLVDSPPFLAVGDSGSLAGLVDGVMVVMRIGVVTRSLLKDAQEFLATIPSRKVGIVVTNASAEARGVYRQRYYQRSVEAAALRPVSEGTGQAPTL